MDDDGALLKELWQAFLDVAPAGVAIFGRDMCYLQASARWKRDYGLEGQDLIGRCHYDVFPELSEERKEIHRRCLAGAVERRDAAPFPRADGRVDWVRWEIRPWHDSAGEIGGIVIFSEIITERVQAEQALKASEARYRTLLEQAPEAILIYDLAAGRFIESNNKAELLFGCTRQDLIERGPQGFYHPVQPDGLAIEASFNANRRRVAAGQPVSFERRIRNAKNEEFFCEVSIVPLPTATGQFARVSYVDITRRKRAEDERLELASQLRQAQKMEVIGQLAGGVAHDFNNLLLAMSLNMEELEALFGRDAAAKPLFEGMRAAAGQARGLTSQLLAFGRRQFLKPETFHPNDVVAQTTRMLRRALPATIDIATELQSSAWPILADRNQLETTLLNLAINARDAMPDGGRVVIGTKNVTLDAADERQHADVSAGDYVLIVVTDTGAGMAPEVAARVFEPFFTTKEVGKGTGLGLSQVYGYVKQSGGHVALCSSPGRGTAVRLYFPRSRMALAQPAKPDRADPPGSRRATILMVEDDPLVARVVERMLKRLGYRVLQAADGAQALAALEGPETIDLLFSDVVLPGAAAGTDIAARAQHLRPGIQVLLTSGYTYTALAGGEPSPFELLSKPYSRDELAERLGRLLAEVPAVVARERQHTPARAAPERRAAGALTP